MSRKYRFGDPDHLHFVTFTAINWIDLFIREEYRQVLVNSVKYCQENKGLEVYGYCLMTSHFHMIMGSDGKAPEGIVRDLKSYTSGRIRELLERTDLVEEGRREWMYRMMKEAGIRNSNNHDFQFWAQADACAASLFQSLILKIPESHLPLTYRAKTKAQA